MAAGLSRISPAVGAALHGIRGSIERFNAATAEVSRAAAEGAAEIGQGADTASFSGTALAKLKETHDPEASLERGLIDQRLAVHDLAANVRVIKTADEMMKSLMDICRPR
jgi:hypothetical protein